ncbi:MAG TPA: hypothetical protein VGM90_29080 [Kofleriaceae bacterium]|jgi:hypothetical protein
MAIDQRALQAALELFVKTFVVDDKRAQIRNRLLTAERRDETLTALPRWLARGVPLEGADRSPAGATKRFGEVLGIQLTATAAQRTTIANALALGRSAASVFIADNGNFAVVTVADGTALLCSRF